MHAYQLLKNANLPKEKRDLALATVPDLTYESMKKQIKAIYDQCSASENKKVESSGDEIQVEFEVYYGQGRGPWRRGPFCGNTRSRGVNIRNRNTGASFSPNQAGRFVPREGHRNPIGRDGRPTQCHSCGSIYHWLPQCPNSYTQAWNTHKLMMRKLLFIKQNTLPKWNLSFFLNVKESCLGCS